MINEQLCNRSKARPKVKFQNWHAFPGPAQATGWLMFIYSIKAPTRWYSSDNASSAFK